MLIKKQKFWDIMFLNDKKMAIRPKNLSKNKLSN